MGGLDRPSNQRRIWRLGLALRPFGPCGRQALVYERTNFVEVIARKYDVLWASGDKQ